MKEINLGRILIENRHKRGITQEELACALGVTNQAVSKWESAQCCPDIQLLPDIADCFGVSIDKLMGHKASVQKQKTEVVVDGLIDKALIILKKARADFNLSASKASLYWVFGGQKFNWTVRRERIYRDLWQKKVRTKKNSN